MQNAGLQYGQDSSLGVTTLQNAASSSTASLRQFRKKEAEKTPLVSSDVDVATSSTTTTTTSQNSSHVARVAPHNHFPPHQKQQQQQGDCYRYHAHSHPHHQYTTDYTSSPFKERTVKYSEIAEIPPLSHHPQHLDLNVNSARLSQQQVRQLGGGIKKSDKNVGLAGGGDYAATVGGDACNLGTSQQQHFTQQQQQQQSYHHAAEMALHHQYLHKEPQMHFAPYKPTESHHHQYIPTKEGGAAVGAAMGSASSFNAAAAFLKYSSNIPQRNYMSVVDAAASHHYGRMEAAHPSHAFRDYAPADYVGTSMDQGRMYAAAVAAQKQRYYAAPNAAAPTSSYPPSPSHNYTRNIQQPFNYSSSCSYPPSRPPPPHHQINRYASHPHQQPVLSPPPPQVLRRSTYHHPHHHLNHHQELMEINYGGSASSVQKIPPTYYHPQSGAYAPSPQHYQQQQQRRGVAPPPPSTHHNIQEYYHPHPHAPPHLGAGARTYHATSAAIVDDDVDTVDDHAHLHHAHLASNNIRQYLENWAEEESNIPDVATETTPTRRNKYVSHQAEAVPENDDDDDDDEEGGGSNANEVYVINASELPQYLENGQYIFKSNVTLDVNALKILEKTTESSPQNAEERIVSLHIVENHAHNVAPTSRTTGHVGAPPTVTTTTAEVAPTIVEDLDKIVQDTLTSQLNDLEKLEENLKIPDDLNLDDDDAEEEEIMDLSTRRSEVQPEENDEEKSSITTKNMPSLIDDLDDQDEADSKLEDELEEKLRELTKDEDTKELQEEEIPRTISVEKETSNEDETEKKISNEEKSLNNILIEEKEAVQAETVVDEIEKQAKQLEVEEIQEETLIRQQAGKINEDQVMKKTKRLEETTRKRKRRIFSVDDIIYRIGSSSRRRNEGSEGNINISEENHQEHLLKNIKQSEEESTKKFEKTSSEKSGECAEKFEESSGKFSGNFESSTVDIKESNERMEETTFDFSEDSFEKSEEILERLKSPEKATEVSGKIDDSDEGMKGSSEEIQESNEKLEEFSGELEEAQIVNSEEISEEILESVENPVKETPEIGLNKLGASTEILVESLEKTEKPTRILEEFIENSEEILEELITEITEESSEKLEESIEVTTENRKEFPEETTIAISEESLEESAKNHEEPIEILGESPERQGAKLADIVEASVVKIVETATIVDNSGGSHYSESSFSEGNTDELPEDTGELMRESVEKNLGKSPENIEDIEKMLEKLEESSEDAMSIEQKLEEIVGLEQENLKLDEDVQYRNVLKIEENNVLLEICGELVELSVNFLNGKKVIQVSSISSAASSTLVDHNDNLENFQSLEMEDLEDDDSTMPILEDETEKRKDEEELGELPVLDKMIEEEEGKEEELIFENEIIIGEDENLEEEVNLDLGENSDEKPKVYTKAAKKSYDDEMIEKKKQIGENNNNNKKKRKIPKKEVETKALKELMERRRIRKEKLRLKEKKKKLENSVHVAKPETVTMPPIEAKRKLSIQEYNSRKRKMAPSVMASSSEKKKPVVISAENSLEFPKKTSSIYAAEKRSENSKDPRRRMEDFPGVVTSTKLPLPLVPQPPSSNPSLQQRQSSLMTSAQQRPPPTPPSQAMPFVIHNHRYSSHLSSFRKKVQFDDNVQINEINTTETKTAKKKKKSGDEHFCEVSSSSEKMAAANDWEEEEDHESFEEEKHRKRHVEEDLTETPIKKKKKIIIDINDLVKELSRKKDEENIKHEIDAKLNELNIEIPKKKKIHTNIEDDQLMRKFLRKDKLNAEEIQKIRRIIYLKKKFQQISNPQKKKKKKRFRNLYTDTSPDSSEVEMPEFSVTKEENFRGVKLIFKRKIFNLQPIVKLQRCDNLIEKF